jgi:SAM-dependent methyltransferase/uncharacterized protein YbaR (Trm112 family)
LEVLVQLASLLACPICHGRLTAEVLDKLYCPTDDLTFQRTNGIWNLLTPQAEKRLSEFIGSYAAVRAQEGRGSYEASFYRSLPYPAGLDRTWRRHWKIRAAGYESLLRAVVQPLEADHAKLTILDLGAGNGWLANRLVERGHDLIAIDLQTNDFDGLGCHRFYETKWSPVQAEFDRLPLLDRSVDLVAFNASLHYSHSLRETIAEALRVLKPGGRIAVLDSPIYNSDRSGQKMLTEQNYKATGYSKIGYLTWSGLNQLATDLGLSTEFTLSPRSFTDLLIRMAKRLWLRREPATFGLVVLHPPSQTENRPI